MSSGSNSHINEIGCRTFLSTHSWPAGLQDTLVKSFATFPLRFFVVDNSGPCRPVMVIACFKLQARASKYCVSNGSILFETHCNMFLHVEWSTPPAGES